jgi:hypothetical protein
MTKTEDKKFIKNLDNDHLASLIADVCDVDILRAIAYGFVDTGIIRDLVYNKNKDVVYSLNGEE